MELTTSKNLLKLSVCQTLMVVGWKKANNSSVGVLLNLTEGFLNSICGYVKTSMESDRRVNTTVFDAIFALRMMSLTENDLINYMNEYGNVEFIYRNVPDYPISYDRIREKNRKEITSTLGDVSIDHQLTDDMIQHQINPSQDNKTNEEKSFNPIKLKILMKGSDVKMSVLVNDEVTSKPFDPDHVDYRSDEEILEDSSYLKQNEIGLSNFSVDNNRVAEHKSSYSHILNEIGHGSDSSLTCPLCIDSNTWSNFEKPTNLKLFTQMICCDSCNVWFHCYCLKVDFNEAQKLNVWYCPKCHPKMSLKHDLRSKNKLTRKHYSNY